MIATHKQVKNFRSGVYQHWKGQKYRSLFLAQNSTNYRIDGVMREATEEPMVIYVSLDAPHTGNVCARELWQWAQMVKWEDGTSKPRFLWSRP